MQLTRLQNRVLREIVAWVRLEDPPVGLHLTEAALAAQIGVSRSPVGAAMHHLAEVGLLRHDANRGYFMARSALAWADLAHRLAETPDDPLYLNLAADCLAQRLPNLITEIDLMRQYGVARSTLLKTLSRVQQEGWVEKSVGHGWAFQAMIDSPQAYEESYAFRLALEPTALLGATFRADGDELAALRKQQAFIARRGWKSMTSIELFESNCQFHETLARWSGNRFILQAIRRTDQLRRLVEYRQALVREPRKVQAGEHLQILDAIEAGDALGAATLMRGHLEGARRAKVCAPQVFAASSSDKSSPGKPRYTSRHRPL